MVDLDEIDASNLSRSILYREADCGRSKAQVAAERLAEIYPRIRARGLHGDVLYDLGLGAYRWADIIIGGLDNREARVAINQSVARAGKVWIDGAIERLDGVVRGMLDGRSNAFVEAMNGLLQQTKTAARGFRKTENFIAIAYLRMSKLKHLPVNPLVPAVPRSFGHYVHTI